MGKKRLVPHLAAFLAIAFFAFMAIGSVSFQGGYVLDDTIPPEQSAKVWFRYFTPKSYNGIDILPTEKTALFTFPAGEATFSGDINWGSTGYQAGGGGRNVTLVYTEEDVVFSYNLEGGQGYTAVVSQEYVEGIKDPVWGIGFYRELKTFVNEKPPKERLIEFIPFTRLERAVLQ